MVNEYVEEQTKNEMDVETLVESAHGKLGKIFNQNSLLKAVPPLDPNDPYPWVYNRTEFETSSYERIKTIPGGWHQDQPFNNLLPDVSGIGTINGKAYAGCAMVAVAQILSYHKKIFKHNGNTLILASDWTAMINNPASSALLQNLMEILFYDMKTSYGINGTSSNISKARSFLNSHQFTAGSDDNYSFSGIYDALQWGPTFMAGSNSSGEGHAWVVDGARSYTTITIDVYTLDYNGKILEATVETGPITTRGVRYDWGYGNYLNINGQIQNVNIWFSDGVFNVNPGLSGFNFNNSVKIISHIKP